VAKELEFTLLEVDSAGSPVEVGSLTLNLAHYASSDPSTRTSPNGQVTLESQVTQGALPGAARPAPTR